MRVSCIFRDQLAVASAEWKAVPEDECRRFVNRYWSWGEPQGLFHSGCLWKSCVIAHVDSLCDHVLLQSLGLEMGWLGHVGQLRSALHCCISEKKEKKTDYIFVYVKSGQAGLFSHCGGGVLVLCYL